MSAHPLKVDVPLIASGVDYCTVTAHAGARQTRLEEFALTLGQGYLRGGYELREAGSQGYRGWTIGPMTYGTRPDGSMLRLSGWGAHYWWDKAVPLAHNVSRLDLQVTIDGGPLATEIAEIHEAEAIEARRGRGRPVKVALTREHERGQTLYLGSRSSNVYRRCYDKHAEKPADYPRGAWRYEIEYKAEVAALVGRSMLDQGNAATAIPALVHRQFARCGVTPLFDPTSSALRDHCPVEPPDVERRLRWLRDDVARTVRRLVAGGYGDLARKALFGNA